MLPTLVKEYVRKIVTGMIRRALSNDMISFSVALTIGTEIPKYCIFLLKIQHRIRVKLFHIRLQLAFQAQLDELYQMGYSDFRYIELKLSC